MPVSPYFQHTSAKPNRDQLLMEDLLNEQIYLMGHDIYYILRETADEIDQILGEDPNSIFQKAYKIAAFINDVDDWTSGAETFSKFGLFINKSNSLVVTRRHFNKSVGNTWRDRPEEGDLVYVPAFEKLFEIKKVSTDSAFQGLGSHTPYYYTLEVEMFKYSHEDIETGIDELDILEPTNAYVIELYMEDGNANNYWKNELVYQGNSYANGTSTGVVKYWDSANSVLGIYNVIGEFENGVAVVGASSGASWNIADYDDKEDNEENRTYSNAEIEADANTTIVRTETNPFGDV